MLQSSRLIYTLLLLFCFTAPSFGQLPESKSPRSDQDLPIVFQIGEHEKQFENLSFSYNTSLLAACEDNMDLAYARWLDMLQHLQDFSKSNGVDLNGVKMWLNVFWNKEGQIDHIAYFLKPQSKNIDHRYLNALISEFSETYQFPMTYPGKFSHYGLARFPVFPTPKQPDVDLTKAETGDGN